MCAMPNKLLGFADSRCFGVGSQPSDDRLAGWWTNNAKLGQDKKNKMKRFGVKMKTCLGVSDRKRRFW